jgi:hypothetical protein
MADMKDAVTSSDVFRAFQMIHFEETFKVDVFVLHQNEYSEVSVARSIPYVLFPGLNVQFASPEDTAITKLRWFLLGNKVSDKQWNDIILVLEKCHGQLEEDCMTHFDVLELLREAQLQAIV